MAQAETPKGVLVRLRTLLKTQGDKWVKSTAGAHNTQGVESFCVMGGAGYVFNPDGPAKKIGENGTLGDKAVDGDVVAQATIKALYTALPREWQDEGHPDKLFKSSPKPPRPEIDPPRLENFYDEDDYFNDGDYADALESYQEKWDKWQEALVVWENTAAVDWHDVENCIFAYNDAPETTVGGIRELVSTALKVA